MRNWKAAILKPDNSLEDAIKVLDREALKIVLVADAEQRLMGTITDGDIRRALIQHMGMDTPIDKVMRNDPTYASIEVDRSELLLIMQTKGLLHIPIVDAEKRIVGLETMQHLLEKRKIDNPVFLMAGGFGKRLQPLTNDVPKPLLNVGTKPILETILNNFVQLGFHNFYISTHYKADMVRQHFGDGSQWGVNITYINEDVPLGTAGALGLLPEEMPELPVLMMNGDLLTEVNFEHLLDFHMEHGGVATMCVKEYDFQVPYGVVQAEGQVIKQIVEKPVQKFFINAGIYVLDQELVKSISSGDYIDMPQLLEMQIDAGKQLNMFPIHEYWLDIGRMEEFERANRDVGA